MESISSKSESVTEVSERLRNLGEKFKFQGIGRGYKSSLLGASTMQTLNGP